MTVLAMAEKARTSSGCHLPDASTDRVACRRCSILVQRLQHTDASGRPRLADASQRERNAAGTFSMRRLRRLRWR
jgi:hypothetical protein